MDDCMKFKFKIRHLIGINYLCNKELIVKRVDLLKAKLKQGETYRREDLVNFSTSIDRHLAELIGDGFLQRLSQGLFYYPKQSVFGQAPPDENKLVRTFLKDDDFLLTSPNVYNSLGVGTTQLYNNRVVYNHKRHGKVRLGNQEFDFRLKHKFPTTATPEFVLVDLVNNLGRLAEDKTSILENVARKVNVMDKKALKKAVDKYGNVSTKKIFAPLL
jgi:hypothetical protein